MSVLGAVAEIWKSLRQLRELEYFQEFLYQPMSLPDVSINRNVRPGCTGCLRVGCEILRYSTHMDIHVLTFCVLQLKAQM